MDLSGFLASNTSLLVGMLFVAVVIAATLIMTAQSDRPEARERSTER